jgi:glucose-6-phosphate 1-dehydrogenase
MPARAIPVDPFDLVVFGATGDLSTRKLLPALYRRFVVGQMPAGARIIGVARMDLDTEAFRSAAREAIMEFVRADLIHSDKLEAFINCIEYVRLDASQDEGWDRLTRLFEKAANRIRVFYLSVAPRLFSEIANRLHQTGLTTPASRIVVEKPLGHDLASAHRLNQQLAECFDESQIYRIDHYLGKETVQNLMALRFANALFEPLWNCRHVDHVQITVAESIGVEGRGKYYDHTGALRDMVQNHLMQLLCLTAMEPPNRFEPDAVRDEKLKVIKALEVISPSDANKTTVRGQYRGNSHSAGYRQEVDNPDSLTESFVALKVRVANWRWSGTPFYLRTGKRLRAQMSEIAVFFKDTPHSIFSPESGEYRGNVLISRLQPREAITLRLNIKDPGPGGMRLTEVPLDMTFAEKLGPSASSLPDAYERLIMDVVRGDQTLFMRWDEVEAAWAWTDPIIAAWEESGQRPREYDPGTAGPDDALMLMHRDGRQWREIEP